LKNLTTQLRFSAQGLSIQRFTLRFALLAALVAIGPAAPFQASAQQSVPAVQPAQASATSGAAKPDAANSEKAPESEQEKNNVYLHAPVVKTIAGMLHLDVETTARIFEGINFAIIVLAIGIPLFRFLPKFLRKRAEKVRNDIESARKVTEDANARLSAVEAKLASLGDEIAKFRAEVEAESVEDEARIKGALAEESARIVAAAEQELTVAAAQAKRGLRHFAADLAIEQAAKQLVLTPETDKALIAEFIGGAGKKGLN
jgi:F-type H+-transporting ATPase subunit b